MKINLSKKEYRLLIEILHLSDWVMHAHQLVPTHTAHEALKKKLLSYYKEMGAEDIIEQAGTDHYYLASGHEEYLHEKFIFPYENETFWEALIDRLSQRDVMKSLGPEKWKALAKAARAEKLDEAASRYAREFGRHGLEHVIVECKGLSTEHE